MSDTTEYKPRARGNTARNGGAGGIWLLGFIGALCYYLHTHSGTFWLVLLALMKSWSGRVRRVPRLVFEVAGPHRLPAFGATIACPTPNGTVPSSRR